MYNSIILSVFFKKFSARFAWEDLQTDFPEGYALLNNKKQPEFFSHSKFDWYGAFTSPGLPFYLHPYAKFKIGDTATITRFNRFEDTLRNAYKNGSFLFDYLKKIPKCQIQALAGSDGKINKNVFEVLKREYPHLATFDYKQVQILNVYGNKNVYSEWFLFPDNSVMLQRYSGNVTYNTNSMFTGLVPMRISAKSDMSSVMFDKTGKRIDSVN